MKKKAGKKAPQAGELLERLRRQKWDWKLIGYGILTAAVLALCAAAPSTLLDTESPPPGEEDADEGRLTRHELWAAWWLSYREGMSLAEPLEKPDMTAVRECEELTHELRLKLAPDIGTGTVTGSGEEYLNVDDRLSIYHSWSEWTGDWSNWLDVFIDMETKEVLYFYLSSQCQRNFERYREIVPTDYNTEAAAERWGNAIGLQLTDCSWSGNPEEYADALYGDMRYRVSMKYYFDADYPSGLFDMMTVCMPRQD